MPALSTCQKRALELAAENGGSLNLYSNGWKGRVEGLHSESVKGSTVRSLARKGLVVLTGINSAGIATRALLKPETGNLKPEGKTGRCCRCGAVGKMASETFNGRNNLCAKCIGYMNGDHLERNGPAFSG